MSNTTTNEGRGEARRRLRFHLGKVLRETRDKANVSRVTIAATVEGRQNRPIDVSTLSNIENGKVMSAQIEDIVTAYAFHCGIRDARSLWRDAMARWYGEGGAPPLYVEFSPQSAAELLAAEAHSAEEAKRQSPPGAGESRSAPSTMSRRRKVR